MFKRINRNFWYICHNCLLHNNHDALNSIFYSESPKSDVLGRPTMICPRCNDANTHSFRELKEAGSESALWGLERLVKKHPRSQFVVKGTKQATTVN